jgi:tetratricopeptide (TPR) repeat protein
MKKLVLNLFVLCFLALMSQPLAAQISTPAPSPASKLMQTVGLTDITVEYSRPGVKGRTIFAADGLVPYGEIWRTGANAATKISFSDDVKVGGEALKAGDYAILSKPNAGTWEVMFFPYEGGNWGAYVEKEPAISVQAKTMETGQKVENFSISIDGMQMDEAQLIFAWDNTAAVLPIEVNVDERVLSNIEQVLAGPTPNDYFAAASYYHQAGKDLTKALEWVKKANDTDQPRFWQVRLEALILADLNRKQEAIEAAKKSMKLAEEAGNKDYVRMNKKSIDEWSK